MQQNRAPGELLATLDSTRDEYKGGYQNKFFDQLMELYKTNPSKEQLTQLLGRARAKRGMFEGDLEDGELEIGQVAGLIGQIKPAAQIVKEIMEEFDRLNKTKLII